MGQGAGRRYETFNILVECALQPPKHGRLQGICNFSPESEATAAWLAFEAANLGTHEVKPPTGSGSGRGSGRSGGGSGHFNFIAVEFLRGIDRTAEGQRRWAWGERRWATKGGGGDQEGEGAGATRGGGGDQEGERKTKKGAKGPRYRAGGGGAGDRRRGGRVCPLP